MGCPDSPFSVRVVSVCDAAVVGEKIQCLSHLCLALLGCCVLSDNAFLGNVSSVLAVSAGALLRLQLLFMSMNLEHQESQRWGNNGGVSVYSG